MTESSEAVKKSLQAVQEAGLDPDSPSGVAMMTEVLRHLLSGGSEMQSADGAARHAHEASVLEGPDQKIAEWAGIEVDLAHDLFEFGPKEEGARVQVRSRDLPAAKADRQRQLALLKLAVERVGYSREDVVGEALVDSCTQYACADQNLRRNLENFENFVIVRGSRRAYSYRLTRPGLDAARDLLRSLAADLSVPSDTRE